MSIVGWQGTFLYVIPFSTQGDRTFIVWGHQWLLSKEEGKGKANLMLALKGSAQKSCKSLRLHVIDQSKSHGRVFL